MTIGPIKALGTVWYVECFGVCDCGGLEAVVATWLEGFEARFSRFRDDSLISKLNQAGVCEQPDPEFVELLTQALYYYDATNGVFNIAVGEQMISVGYDSEYSLEATGGSVAPPALPAALQITKEKITLTQGQLDLGGIGKGYAIDGLAKYLQETFNQQHFLINGGGDIYVTNNKGEASEIVLQHPQHADQQIGSVFLKHQGFAASSPFVRSWTDQKTGVKHNHLLTTNNVAAYVVAPSATEADVWATTLSIAPNTPQPASIQSLILQNETVLRTDDIFMLN